MPSSPLARFFCLPIALCLAVLIATAAALAQASDAAPAPDDLGALSRRWVDDALSRNPPPGLPLRMQVSVGALDARLRLAPCARVEPYLPQGARLWGQTRLGLRCAEGAVAWNVFVPLSVQAIGPAWVLTRNVAAGAPLAAGDALEAQVDWAAQAAAVLLQPAAWLGQIAARPLLAGQALRQNMLRAPDLLRAGAQVKLLAQGPGYVVTAAGQALTAGAQGQTVRVRMDNGRVVSALVRDAETVELPL